ncbi:hypothetical protein ALC62_13033 [Cyphomyrmex costatus]|uniref:Uncharacterized protein n=1 Tax=Cyphomyrmex costatus TaxID=456900 RepID=A0A195C885_9HYME|nr:hypothetical protein ALC62_13033 [Cyphomyrmex costatus]
MPTKKGEQWYADWIVAAGVCTYLPGSLQSKDEVLLRLDNLLRQRDDELAGVHAADKRHFTAKKRGDSKMRYKKRYERFCGANQRLLVAGVVRDGCLSGGGERASLYKALPRGRTATVSLVENIRRREKSRRQTVAV